MAKAGNSKTTMVLVLGAGATRACSFVDPHKWPCLPPLNKDFFTQLQRVPDRKHQELIKKVLKDVTTLFGTNFSVTLEDVFSTLEHTIRMLSVTRGKRAIKITDLREMRQRLISAIAVALEASLVKHEKGHAKRSPQTCEHHEKLVKDVLKSGDHIISFNYDCVIDYALKEHGNGKWNPHYGYGFGLGPRGSGLIGHKNWRPAKPANARGTIHLHKLHGSLHWWIHKKSGNVQLKKRPYTKQRGIPRFTIIPPESNKPYDQGVFARLWSNAAKALGKAKILVVVGYSLAPTDLHANALFRTSVRKEQFKSVVLVNPSQQDRARIRSAIQRGLSPKTRVLSFDTLAEFLSTDTAVWRGRWPRLRTRKRSLGAS